MTEGRQRLDRFVAGPSAWSEVVHLAEVDSTNDEVARRVRDGAPAGLVVVADHQTTGRGRAGRQWQDVDGGNLSVSVATGVPGTAATLVPLAAGLAVSDALRRQGVRPALKWPNDVLLPAAPGAPADHAKCAGILVDVHDLGPDGPTFLAIGIGIDLDWRGVERAGEAAAWTSLAEHTGGDVDRWDLLHDLLRALESWLLDVPDDPTRLLAQYRVRCRTLGAPVRVTTPGGDVLEGVAVDVRADGALVVDSPASGRQAVLAGDVDTVRRA